MRWLEMIRDHVAANLGIEKDDFERATFSQEGGLGKACLRRRQAGASGFRQ